MKYLKYLRLFESDVSKEEILDCFADLTDIGFVVNIRWSEGLCIVDIINDVRLPEGDVKFFHFEDIEETLLFAMPYLISNGMRFLEITVVYFEFNYKPFAKTKIFKNNDYDYFTIKPLNDMINAIKSYESTGNKIRISNIRIKLS